MSHGEQKTKQLQMQQQRLHQITLTQRHQVTSNANNKITVSTTLASKPRKLSYKEQRELEGLPERIAALEAEQKQVQADLADPKLYASDAAKVAQLHARDVAIESELMQALERWELLSA